MAFDPIIASTRFGYGLSPRISVPADIIEMLGFLKGPDAMAERFPITGFADTAPKLFDFRELLQAIRRATGEERDKLRVDRRAMVQQRRERLKLNHLASIARGMEAQDALRERLVAFWADHFTVAARAARTEHLVTPFVEDAIRPHLTGRFRDMLWAVAQHPMMLMYLDQSQSFGPNSKRGLRRNRGLNENLARELLELHLLGVQGPYTQDDVRQLAELLTGLSYTPARGFRYLRAMAEPGAETVLGVRYSEENSLRNVRRALERISEEPETAQFLATKMAVHFVSDDPDPDMVAAMADSYMDTKGDLFEMTEAMLRSPAAWSPDRVKVRAPQEYITASLRALGVRGEEVLQLQNGPYKRLIAEPCVLMGQPFERPNGPDGWPERAENWIIPQTMAARITWALNAPQRLKRPLPDPRDFVLTALGPDAAADVVFAASAAEAVPDGIGIVLSSAAFQRR